MPSAAFTRRAAIAATAAVVATAMLNPLAKAQTAPPARQVLWAANVRNKSLTDRLEAADSGHWIPESVPAETVAVLDAFFRKY